MRDTCVCTVFRDKNNSAAMSGFDRPPATRRAIFTSVGVSAPHPDAGRLGYRRPPGPDSQWQQPRARAMYIQVGTERLVCRHRSRQRMPSRGRIIPAGGQHRGVLEREAMVKRSPGRTEIVSGRQHRARITGHQPPALISHRGFHGQLLPFRLLLRRRCGGGKRRFIGQLQKQPAPEPAAEGTCSSSTARSPARSPSTRCREPRRSCPPAPLAGRAPAG